MTTYPQIDTMPSSKPIQAFSPLQAVAIAATPTQSRSPRNAARLWSRFGLLVLVLAICRPAVADEVEGVVYLPLMEGGFYIIDHEAGCYGFCLLERCVGPWRLPDYRKPLVSVPLEDARPPRFEGELVCSAMSDE